MHIIVRFYGKILASERHIALDKSVDVNGDTAVDVDDREGIAHIAPRYMGNRIRIDPVGPKWSRNWFGEMPAPPGITDEVEYVHAMAVRTHGGNAAEP